MPTAAQVASGTARAGRQVMLRRLAPHGVYFDVTLMASIRDFDQVTASSGATQFRRLVVISNQEIAQRQWPGPPDNGDQIVLDDGSKMTIQSVLSKVVNGETVLHRMLAVGA